MLRRTCFRGARPSDFPRASITNARFMPRANARLVEAMETKKYKSKFWLTAAQARRSCNTHVRVGEKPTQICLEAEEVYPITKIDRTVAQRIMEVNPPYFGNGVGILGSKGKWNLVQAKRLVSVLATGTDQDLWIDRDYVEAHSIAVAPGAEPLNIAEQSSVLMFNADQLEHPHRGEPQEGMALNISTGKRLPQPAHDALLAHGILRGYESCFWLSKQQLEMYRVTARASDLITAPTAAGVLVPYHLLPPEFRVKVEARITFPKMHEMHDVFHTLNVAGWERTRSSRVTSALVEAGLQAKDMQWKKGTQRFFWANIDELQMYCDSQAELASLKDLLVEPHVPRVDLAEISARGFYNASATSAPERCTTRVRSLHVFLGNPVGKKYAQLLREEYATRSYSNPIWVNKSEAKRLGVQIRDAEMENYVQLEKTDSVTGDLYHLHDVVGYEEILKRVPPPQNPSAPWCLLVTWMPVLGKQKQSKLKKMSRDGVNLWVSLSEVLMANLRLVNGAVPVQFADARASVSRGGGSSAIAGEGDEADDSDEADEESVETVGEQATCGSSNSSSSSSAAAGGPRGLGLTLASKDAYNASQTTDVVRIIGKSRYFVRPQGGLSAG